MKRSTPTARPVSSGRSDQLQPPDRCPMCEAIKLHAPDGCPAGEGRTSTPTAGLDRGRRTSVNSVVSVRAACEGPTSNSASAAFPLGLSPCNRDHAPRFLWSETVVKAKQCNHYYQTVFGVEYALEAIWPTSVDLGHINVMQTYRKVHIVRAAVPRIVAAHHFRQRPKVTLRISSAFFRSLRVSESAVLRQVI